MFKVSVTIVVVCVCGFVLSVPPDPTWPKLYKSCVNVMSDKSVIKAGWYVDVENRVMRLDSYGVPEGMNHSTAQVFQYYLSETEDFEYACAQYGPPLYIFLYHYSIGKMFSLFPDADHPYRSCTASTIYNKFPNSPLLPDVEFVDEGHDNITNYHHWRSEFFLYTMDYLFHVNNGLPYKLIVNGEENLFLSVHEGPLDVNTFQPPVGVVCT